METFEIQINRGYGGYSNKKSAKEILETLEGLELEEEALEENHEKGLLTKKQYKEGKKRIIDEAKEVLAKKKKGNRY